MRRIGSFKSLAVASINDLADLWVRDPDLDGERASRDAIWHAIAWTGDSVFEPLASVEVDDVKAPPAWRYKQFPTIVYKGL